MKLKSRLFYPLAAAVLLSFSSYHGFSNGIEPEKEANNSDFSIVKTKENGRLLIKANNLYKENYSTFSILTKGGSTVFSEQISGKENVLKKYNLQELSAGKYTLRLESNGKQTFKEIVVGYDGEVREDKTQQYKNFRPVVLERGDKIQVMMENPDEQTIKIKMITDNAETVYVENVPGYGKFASELKLNKLPQGSYRLLFIAPDYEFTYDFVK